MSLVKSGSVASFIAISALVIWPMPLLADTFNVTYEAPGVESANMASLCAALGPGTCMIGTETFDGETIAENPSTENFTTNFGTGGVITGTYTGVQVYPANVNGGAGGTGNFADTHSIAGYTLTLSTTLSTGLNYFGFWLSALDPGNIVTFYDNGSEVYQFTPTDVLNLIGNCSSTSNAYCGNPNDDELGGNDTQPYVFLNFFDETGSFNEIVFSEDPEVGGYESDNQTVGYVTGTSGTPINAPEPSSIVTLAAALLGLVLMRRRVLFRAQEGADQRDKTVMTA